LEEVIAALISYGENFFITSKINEEKAIKIFDQYLIDKCFREKRLDHFSTD
jgi:hypothetical protein